jgi:hypothetical protein
MRSILSGMTRNIIDWLRVNKHRALLVPTYQRQLQLRTEYPDVAKQILVGDEIWGHQLNATFIDEVI